MCNIALNLCIDPKKVLRILKHKYVYIHCNVIIIREERFLIVVSDYLIIISVASIHVYVVKLVILP